MKTKIGNKVDEIIISALNILPLVLRGALVFGVLFLCASFIQMTFDFTQGKNDARVIYIVSSLIFSVILTIIYYIEID